MENSMNVQIKDYQIIKTMNLEFVPGLNVIVGPSNNGKSSILKAIKALLYTVPGATPIRAGKPYYAVGINYNGHKVILQKGLKDSVYMVDGEKYSKYGVNTPPAVVNALNLKELELNGKKEQLNFWDQLNYPFLLDKTPTDLFRFIVDSGDDDQISKALKDMVSDRQQLNRTVDQIQGTINAIDIDINSYSLQLDNAKSTIDTCDKILDLLPKVGRYNSLVDSKKVLDTIGTNKTIIQDRLNKSNLEKLNKLFNEVKEKYDRLDLFTEIYNNLSKLKNNITVTNSELVKHGKYKLIKPQVDQNLPELKNIYNTLNYINDKKKQLKTNPVTLCKVNQDNLQKTISLKELLNTNIKQELQKIETKKDDTNEDIIYYNSLKKLFNICPFCGNKIHN